MFFTNFRCQASWTTLFSLKLLAHKIISEITMKNTENTNNVTRQNQIWPKLKTFWHPTKRCALVTPALASALVSLLALALVAIGLSANPASAQDQPADTTFDPVIRLRFPSFNDNGDTTNDLAGTQFTISFSPVTGSHPDCTESASRTYTVPNQGLLEPSSSTGFPLVDRPAGVAFDCVYAVAWTDLPELDVSVSLGNNFPQNSVSASAETIAIIYMSAANRSFTPSVSIGVPQSGGVGGGGVGGGAGVNDWAGTRFEVMFESASPANPDGCSEAMVGAYVVRDDGEVVPDGTEPSLVYLAEGEYSSCSYDVIWPDVAGLVRQPGATTGVRTLRQTAAAVYEAEAPEPDTEADAAEPEAGSEPEPETADPETASPETAADPETETAAQPESNGAQTVAPAQTAVPTQLAMPAQQTEPQPESPAFDIAMLQLPRGWTMLPFNGPSGMTPAEFALALEGAVNSVWVWDIAGQQWQGWAASRGSLGLASLEPGDVVMVYAPVGGVVVYRPSDLLGHPPGTNSWTLAPSAISLAVYGGTSAVAAADLLGDFAGSVVAVYLWDADNQSWEYHLPGRQPLSGVQVPWFSDINPGDAMFVYNISPTAVTIPWQ